MGAKTWLIMYADGDPKEILRTRPQLDRTASAAVAAQLFPADRFTEAPDGSLAFACPPDNTLMVACFPGLTIVADGSLGIDYPSRLDRRFIDHAAGRKIYLHCMHSVVDWFAFAVWEKGQLRRALSLSPDSGIMEDEGERLPFEAPYWSGQRPAVDPEEDPAGYPLPFHPLEMGEDTLKALFGYNLEGEIDPTQVDPQTIRMMVFARKKAWWKLW